MSGRNKQSPWKPKRWCYGHDRILELLVKDPRLSTAELAQLSRYTRQQVSAIINRPEFERRYRIEREFFMQEALRLKADNGDPLFEQLKQGLVKRRWEQLGDTGHAPQIDK